MSQTLLLLLNCSCVALLYILFFKLQCILKAQECDASKAGYNRRGWVQKNPVAMNGIFYINFSDLRFFKHNLHLFKHCSCIKHFQKIGPLFRFFKSIFVNLSYSKFYICSIKFCSCDEAAR